MFLLGRVLCIPLGEGALLIPDTNGPDGRIGAAVDAVPDRVRTVEAPVERGAGAALT